MLFTYTVKEAAPSWEKQFIMLVWHHAVVAQGHTVILNWNSQLTPLLKQMSLAKSHQIKAIMYDK